MNKSNIKKLTVFLYKLKFKNTMDNYIKKHEIVKNQFINY